MTTPLQEYIITEEWVRKLEKPGRGLMWLAKRIRSRPHTQPPTLPDEVCRICEDCRVKHDITIRKAEREKVLSFLDELISDRVSDARKREIIESLRREQ